MPSFCDDDVLDYMITEAIMVKVMREDQKAEKKRQMDEWKKDRQGMKPGGAR